MELSCGKKKKRKSKVKKGGETTWRAGTEKKDQRAMRENQ